jgi:hypothetical protein
MMPNIAEKLITAMNYLGMHIAEASSGIINKIGIVSVGSGLTNTAVTAVIEPQNQTWLTVSTAVAILSIVGSTMFIIKIVVDIYYARKKDRREQDLHDRNRVTK